MAMKYYQQLDLTDCGACCLAMIMSHYDNYTSIAKIREIAGTDYEGTNLNGLLVAAEKLGFQAQAVKGDISALNSDTPRPFIVHVEFEREEYGSFSHHFFVVQKIKNNRIYIWDPDPLNKKKKYTLEEFERIWSGYAVFMEPNSDFRPERDEGRLLFKFLPILLPHRKTLAMVILSSVLLVVFGIVSSFYYKYIYDQVLGAKAVVTLATVSIGIIFIILFRSAVGAIRSKLLAHFSFKSGMQLNFSYIRHIFNLPLSFFESRKTGEIVTRLNDLNLVRNVLSSTATSIIMDIAMILIVGPVLWNISGRLFAISVVSILVVSSVVLVFSKLFRRIYSKAMMQRAEVDSYLVESISGVSTIKSLNAEKYFFEKYSEKHMDAQRTAWKSNNYTIAQQLITGAISAVTGIITFWVGTSSIINGVFSFGTLITFNALAAYFTGPLARLVNVQSSLQQAFVAADRVGEILDIVAEQEEDEAYIEPSSLEGGIELDNVTFRYGSRPAVYQNLSLKIEPGSWTAIVGPSGSGKTTLVKLLLKFYLPERGTVKIDGYNIRDIDAKFLRAKIGYVPQDIFLFSGTVSENIALHKPGSDMEAIMEAARKAGADDFINNLPGRYHTKLGERGSGLSGGERQRIALARAFLNNPSLIILDEATSNLDALSENNLHNVIQGLKAEKISVIIIAHRLTTVTDCDSIFVMEQGRVVQQGNHNELLEQDGLYKNMWNGMMKQ
ncbi:MAG: peptidase domain-containing ABC transporter [Spirochaetales bacterium]|nr:peptidase domain-containing ABC transporter [Spirochaetales bacterium]